jgi:outer membrane biosynthesis protein TonB
MKSSLNLRHSHVRRWLPGWLTALAATPLIALAAGCASPGPAQPPSLDLPEAVKDLTAERVGDQVRLQWTSPEKTTDRLAIKGPMTAELCRIALSATPPSCAPVKRMPVQSGVTQATDTLPPTLTVDPVSLLAYRVQILNSHGRSAGLSPEAFAAAGAAPPSVEQLRATPTRDGAMLEWQPKTPAAAAEVQLVELDRLPVGPNGVVIEPPPPKAAKSSSKPTIKNQAEKPKPQNKSQNKSQNKPQNNPQKPPTPKPLQMTAPTPTEVKLRTPKSPNASTDAGGTLDPTAQMGDTYRYTAQRVRSVSLSGHALELRGPASSPVTLLMRNTFPPRAPSGLEAVPGGATAADRSIDLSWTPNTDPDLAGYIVYRQEIDTNGVAAATATRLNPTPVVGPAYRDQTAVAGRRYAYRVTAIDTAGNESAPSDPVQEILREQ